MIGYKDIEKIYGMRIPKKFKVMLGDKILDDLPQEMISKALDYNLSDADIQILGRVGHQSRRKSYEYPGLYYICAIFIHPLTKYQALAKKVDRLIASFD